MELGPQLGVGWPCVTFQSIRSWASARPPVVLRRTTEAVDFIRKVAVVTPDRAWQDLLQSFEADEWSARKPSSTSSYCSRQEAY
jgi:hypothetical protein